MKTEYRTVDVASAQVRCKRNGVQIPTQKWYCKREQALKRETADESHHWETGKAGANA